MILMMRRKATVVIPARNAEATIGQCISSVLAQRPAPMQVIIVINDSADQTAHISKSFGKKVKVLALQEKGSYAARNEGIRHAKGDILVFLDADCIPQKGWLAHLMRSFSDPSVAIVGGAITALRKENALQRFCDVFCHEQERFMLSSPPFFATANMAIRRNWKGEGMLFNSSLCYGGDVEICARMRKKGGRLHYASGAIVKHSYPSSLLDFVSRHVRYGWGMATLSQRFSIAVKKPSEPLMGVWRSYGIIFLSLRMLQSISYHAGLVAGRAAWILK
jgi:cellulose synthase/poly-beta-1,6-N-acetylglucosamine synthase-like glycosyltransferase